MITTLANCAIVNFAYADVGGCCFDQDVCVDSVPKSDCLLIGGTPLMDGLSCSSDPDNDSVIGCDDQCPYDETKSDPGICGCGVPDDDSDFDGTVDCQDGCPDDPEKTEPGVCGCGISDDDLDVDGIVDCVDECLDTPFGHPIDEFGCQASGACCFDVGVCLSNVPVLDCIAIDGTYQGDGSLCGDGCLFTVIPDFDQDGVVGLSDFAIWQACLGGPDTNLPKECVLADTDTDGDADMHDFSWFQVQFGITYDCFVDEAAPSIGGTPSAIASASFASIGCDWHLRVHSYHYQPGDETPLGSDVPSGESITYYLINNVGASGFGADLFAVENVDGIAIQSVLIPSFPIEGFDADNRHNPESFSFSSIAGDYAFSLQWTTPGLLPGEWALSGLRYLSESADLVPAIAGNEDLNFSVEAYLLGPTIPSELPICGNGVTEPPEECDPPDGFFCDSDCTFIGGGDFDCPGTGDCFVGNATPGCDDEACCESVCALDSFCCTGTWDELCADAAAFVCGVGNAACEPGAGSCTQANGTPGCDDELCCNSTCAVLPTCCSVAWDQDCADVAFFCP